MRKLVRQAAGRMDADTEPLTVTRHLDRGWSRPASTQSVMSGVMSERRMEKVQCMDR